ncbi:hypothetical protein Zm00014a_036205 [Zea mays]|uniref:Uncharacterized protein n=1 Tax=Zea mays TaxID=4577 RepID=A0A3L6DXH9_MAIZE|nr:hypothetical protein Zm00014a_036205 [Zea mays]
MGVIELANTWGHPPEGVLEHIFSYLPSYADRASCACVCRQWYFYAREKESTTPLFPCLLRPSISGASCFHLFSRTCTSMPTVPAARFCGSMEGQWFVVARDQWRGYALLHLASGTQILLPQGLLQEDGDRFNFNDLWVGLESTDLIIRAATAFRAPRYPDGDEHYFVAAITLGEHRAAACLSGNGRWALLEPDQGIICPDLDKMLVMYEEMEDVIYYSCSGLDGFFFLTTEEHLMVFLPDDDGEGHITGEVLAYLFRGHTMASPPEAGHVVAARYLVESEGRLLMVKRFVSPCQGQQSTVSFQVFTLMWDNWNRKVPRWEKSSPTSAPLLGKMLFVGRGCSRAIGTGRTGPAFIYFLDDAVASPYELLTTIIRTEKEYRCSDMGWCRYDQQYIGKDWPQGPPADCSPWIWLYR